MATAKRGVTFVLTVDEDELGYIYDAIQNKDDGDEDQEAIASEILEVIEEIRDDG